MKYKVGDKVRIESIDWYNKNKDSNGDVVVLHKVPHFYWYENVRTVFTKDMVKFCGKVVTIESVCTVNYSIGEGTYRYYFTDEMIKGLVEEPVLSAPSITEGVFIYEKEMKRITEYVLPEGHVFKDENGNVINTTKIVLEKKKKEYPKTYEECEKVLRYDSHRFDNMGVTVRGYKWQLIRAFQILLICRDAYWKLYGEEMGLGKPWEPDWSNQELPKYCITIVEGQIKTTEGYIINTIFAFPTEEMRDAFYENFKELIEQCKELL